MNFPQFWARGKSGDFFAWRWSFTSLTEAQTLADQAAQQLANRIWKGNRPKSHWGYYPNRPFREQILKEITNETGEIAAVITRNSYGCQVLNTAKVMFVDIDLPETKTSFGFLKKLFGTTETAPPTNPENDAIQRIENWTRNNSQWGWRIYRTRAGLRLLATQGLVRADSPAAVDVFEALGADPLYQKLCQTQNCFRARLTPKPWRCGVRGKPERWPWLNIKNENQFQKWDAHYQARSASFATCTFLRQIGSTHVHSEIHLVQKLHDDSTRSESGLPLA